jgi:prolyl-tRNA synthetase
VVRRQSELFLPTLRDDPADADAISHKLLVRAGMIRQVSAGLWSFLPAGWRTHERIVQIVREEMDAIGGQEMFMPVITPAELWEKTGRDRIPELFRFDDRGGRAHVLALTHEETVTFHFAELGSYRDLPKILYHFQTKGRDEARPRGGLLRVREFVMKDAYTFDRDEEGLAANFQKHARAYETIFERCGLDAVAVQAESGMMGGTESIDYLAPSGSGENTLVTCANGDYAADLEIARGIPRPPTFPDRLDGPSEVATPGIGTIDELAEFLGIDPAATSKAMPVTKDDGTVVLGLIRGDDRLEEAKLATALGSGFRASTEEEIRAAFGADPGSLGPIGFKGEIVADDALREGQFVAGANRTGWHLRGVEHGRDYTARFADIRQPIEGDACPLCGGRLGFQTAIEVGHIFKLGTRYSEALGATFLDEEGKTHPIVMGSYGIGPGRIMAASVEQRHDENGIVWPRSIAPYDAHVLALHGSAPEVIEPAVEVADLVASGGFEVLLDDRAQRPGEKFADADLLGVPIRITVGKKTLDDGAVDVRIRATGADDRVPRETVLTWIEEL